MTKPRPDQPGRCPSIDPHDTLQCTRSIHDDDQCQAGGIAWRKGSPRIESDRERADRLQEDVEEYDAILRRQGDLLTRTVNALRGNPPPLTSWSHHDIPELAAEKVSEVERLTEAYQWTDQVLTAVTAERDALAESWNPSVEDDRRWPYPAAQTVAELVVDAVLDKVFQHATEGVRRHALDVARKAVSSDGSRRGWTSDVATARVLAERDALAAQVARLAKPGDPDARMDAYYYGFTRTGVGLVDDILSAVAKAGKSFHGTDMWNEELYDGGTCESRIQDAADAAAEQIRAALAGSEADTSDTQPADQEDQA